MVGQNEVDGELRRDRRRGRRARLHEGERGLGGIDVRGDFLPRLHECRVLYRLRREIGGREGPGSPAAAAAAGGPDQQAGGVAVHFSLPSAIEEGSLLCLGAIGERARVWEE